MVSYELNIIMFTIGGIKDIKDIKYETKEKLSRRIFNNWNGIRKLNLDYSNVNNTNIQKQ